jgi:hypothetical protein
MAKKKTTSRTDQPVGGDTLAEVKKRITRKEAKERNDVPAGKLKLQQEKFCQLYATTREFFGNGTQSYAEAYGIDLTTKGGNAVARQGAYQLLTNIDILKRIDELLELGPLNDTTIDKQLAFLVEQNAELGTKLGAIREYNKLKGRITDKLEAKIETEMTEEQANAVIERYLAKERDFEQSPTAGGDQGKAKPPRSA